MTGGCIDVVDDPTIISGKDRMISGGCGGAQEGIEIKTVATAVETATD